MATVLISHSDCLKHVTPENHPERVDRLISIMDSLKNFKDPDLVRLDAPEGSETDILRVHPIEYLDNLKQKSPVDGFVALDPDTFMSAGSLPAAMRGVGGIIKAVDLVMTDQANNVFVVTRPPGHHAEKETSMGFCLFGNVSIAAKYALDHHKLPKVAVVDFDVHHGNGTQDILWNEKRSLFISSHQMPLYPGTGKENEIGIENNILNIPLPPNTMGKDFRYLYENKVFPALEKFSPDLLLVSAGFDAHASDPLANINLAEEDFAWVTGRLCDLADKHCNGRLVSTLEGGYDLDALAKCVTTHLKTLLDRGRNV
ncbi:MAG: histone deacetylase family protein [Paracoccaceae bacterium]